MVAESPKDIVGPTLLKVQEGNQIAQGNFCNVKVKLACPKPVLHQGETSTLTATVIGLANVQNATLSIDNNSPDVLSLTGGDHQVLPLAPGSRRCTTRWGVWRTVLTRASRHRQSLRRQRPFRLRLDTPPVVPPEGSQTGPDGTTTNLYPGGTTIVTPPGGGIPISIPPGLGSAPPGSPGPGHGDVIARQVEPNGTVVQVYSNGFVSRTPPGGTPQWDKDPIF